MVTVVSPPNDRSQRSVQYSFQDLVSSQLYAQIKRFCRVSLFTNLISISLRASSAGATKFDTSGSIHELEYIGTKILTCHSVKYCAGDTPAAIMDRICTWRTSGGAVITASINISSVNSSSSVETSEPL